MMLSNPFARRPAAVRQGTLSGTAVPSPTVLTRDECQVLLRAVLETLPPLQRPQCFAHETFKMRSPSQ